MSRGSALGVAPLAGKRLAMRTLLLYQTAGNCDSMPPRGPFAVIEVDAAVVCGDAGQGRMRLNGHEPLRNAIIGLPDAADLARRPRLAGDPVDDFVMIALLAPIRQGVFAF